VSDSILCSTQSIIAYHILFYPAGSDRRKKVEVDSSDVMILPSFMKICRLFGS
jgi:hypothetical protein